MERVGRTRDPGAKSSGHGRSASTCPMGGLLSAPGPRSRCGTDIQIAAALSSGLQRPAPATSGRRGSSSSLSGWSGRFSLGWTLAGLRTVSTVPWKRSLKGLVNELAPRTSETCDAPSILAGPSSAWLYESVKAPVRSKSLSGQSIAVIGQRSRGTSRHQPRLSACTHPGQAVQAETLQDKFAIY
jgi:hypothetical protein